MLFAPAKSFSLSLSLHVNKYIQTHDEMYYYTVTVLLLYDCAVVDIIEVYDYYLRSDGHPLISALRQTVRR